MQHQVPVLQTGPRLANVKVTASAVIPYPEPDVWALVRKWGSMCTWFPTIHTTPGGPASLFRSQLLAGFAEGMVGAIRCLSIGDGVAEGRIHEQLTSLSDEDCSLSYKLKSHPGNNNPFPASFVNCTLTQKLFPVTVGNQTVFSWSTEFFTDPESAELMRLAFQMMFEEGFANLQNYLALRKATSGGGLSNAGANPAQQQQMGTVPLPMGAGYQPTSGGVTQMGSNPLQHLQQHLQQQHLQQQQQPAPQAQQNFAFSAQTQVLEMNELASQQQRQVQQLQQQHLHQQQAMQQQQQQQHFTHQAFVQQALAQQHAQQQYQAWVAAAQLPVAVSVSLPMAPTALPVSGGMVPMSPTAKDRRDSGDSAQSLDVCA